MINTIDECKESRLFVERVIFVEGVFSHARNSRTAKTNKNPREASSELARKTAANQRHRTAWPMRGRREGMDHGIHGNPGI